MDGETVRHWSGRNQMACCHDSDKTKFVSVRPFISENIRSKPVGPSHPPVSPPLGCCDPSPRWPSSTATRSSAPDSASTALSRFAALAPPATPAPPLAPPPPLAAPPTTPFLSSPSSLSNPSTLLLNSASLLPPSSSALLSVASLCSFSAAPRLCSVSACSSSETRPRKSSLMTSSSATRVLRCETWEMADSSLEAVDGGLEVEGAVGRVWCGVVVRGGGRGGWDGWVDCRDEGRAERNGMGWSADGGRLVSAGFDC